MNRRGARHPRGCSPQPRGSPRRPERTPLRPHRRFQFRDPDGSVLASAEDLAEFVRLLASVDASVVAHHLEHGDFSRWFSGTLQDHELGALAGAIERDVLARRAADVVHARQRLLDELEARYPA